MKISKAQSSTSILSAPPTWASAWGNDAYGLFADLSIAGSNTSKSDDTKSEPKQVTQRFRLIAPGEFMMGSPEYEAERIDERENYHQVSLSHFYWLADTTVTQEFWQTIMGENPAHFTDDLNNPVEQVSWDNAQVFIQRLNEQFKAELDGDVIRLPSEAEWEHACRAGTETPFSFGDNITPKQVNYNGNYSYNNAEKGESRKKTIAVKSLPANPWGLYEMHGNIWEWSADAWKDQLGEQKVIDPFYNKSNVHRVVRGGSWNDDWNVRSAIRIHISPDVRFDALGLRLSLGHELQSRSEEKEKKGRAV